MTSKKCKLEKLSLKERVEFYNRDKYSPEWYAHKKEIRIYYIDILKNYSSYKAGSVVTALFDLYYIREVGDDALAYSLLNAVEDSIKVAALHFLGRFGKWELIYHYIYKALTSENYSIEVKNEALLQLSYYLPKEIEAAKMLYEILDGNKYNLQVSLYCDAIIYACEFAGIKVTDNDSYMLYMDDKDAYLPYVDNEVCNVMHRLEQETRNFIKKLLENV